MSGAKAGPVPDWLVSGYRTWLKQPKPRHDYAKMFDLSPAEMREIRARAGVVEPRRQRHPNEYIDAASRGLTQTQAAAELGVRPSAVHMAAKRHGITFVKVARYQGRPPVPKGAASPPDPAAPSEDGCTPGAIQPAAVLAPIPQSPAAVAGPGGGAPDDRLGDAAASPSEPSPITRRALSLHHKTGCTIEEAQHIAGLRPVGLNAPLPAAATAREGVTRYPNPGFRLGASLLEAAPSRDRRRLSHAPTDSSEHAT